MAFIFSHISLCISFFLLVIALIYYVKMKKEEYKGKQDDIRRVEEYRRIWNEEPYAFVPSLNGIHELLIHSSTIISIYPFVISILSLFLPKSDSYLFMVIVATYLFLKVIIIEHVIVAPIIKIDIGAYIKPFLEISKIALLLLAVLGRDNVVSFDFSAVIVDSVIAMLLFDSAIGFFKMKKERKTR